MKRYLAPELEDSTLLSCSLSPNWSRDPTKSYQNLSRSVCRYQQANSKIHIEIQSIYESQKSSERKLVIKMVFV